MRDSQKLRRKRSLLPVYLVVCTMLLATPFFQMATNFTLQLFAEAGDTQAVNCFMMIGTLVFVTGTWLGGKLSVAWRNFRTVAMVGTALAVPFQFCYWSFVSSTENSLTLSNFFWRAFLTYLVAVLGLGMVYVAAVSYLAKWYSLSHSKTTGRVVGHWAMVIPLGTLNLFWILVVYTNTANATVLGAVTTTLSAVCWFFVPAVCKDRQLLEATFKEHRTFWAQKYKYLVMLCPFIAVFTFDLFAWKKTMTMELELREISCFLSLSAQLAAVVFFGKAFDQCRIKGQHTWSFFAFVTCLFVLLEYTGSIVNLGPLTVGLCHLTGTGGLVYYMSHMLFHSDSSEISSVVAFFSLFALGKVITLFFFVFNPTTAVAEVVYLIVFTVMTFALTRTIQFPCNENERQKYQLTNVVQ